MPESSPEKNPEAVASIEVRELNVALSGKRILRDLSVRIPRGYWVAVIGPNGSGKTTLLRAVGGLIPYEGSIQVDGREVGTWSPRALARRMAFVRQSHALSFDFTVRDLVLLGRSPHKSFLSTYDGSDYDHVHRALDLVDLNGFADRPYESLSGGEQQRVFLAQALVQEASILLLDEPTTYLDVHHQFEFLEHIRSLVRGGMTVVGAIHDLELAARYADAVLVLDHGRRVAGGAPADVLTPQIIEKVFRMRARVDSQRDGAMRIEYDMPL